MSAQGQEHPQQPVATLTSRDDKSDELGKKFHTTNTISPIERKWTFGSMRSINFQFGSHTTTIRSDTITDEDGDIDAKRAKGNPSVRMTEEAVPTAEEHGAGAYPDVFTIKTSDTAPDENTTPIDDTPSTSVKTDESKVRADGGLFQGLGSLTSAATSSLASDISGVNASAVNHLASSIDSDGAKIGSIIGNDAFEDAIAQDDPAHATGRTRNNTASVISAGESKTSNKSSSIVMSQKDTTPPVDNPHGSISKQCIVCLKEKPIPQFIHAVRHHSLVKTCRECRSLSNGDRQRVRRKAQAAEAFRIEEETPTVGFACTEFLPVGEFGDELKSGEVNYKQCSTSRLKKRQDAKQRQVGVRHCSQCKQWQPEADFLGPSIGTGTISRYWPSCKKCTGAENNTQKKQSAAVVDDSEERIHSSLSAGHDASAKSPTHLSDSGPSAVAEKAGAQKRRCPSTEAIAGPRAKKTKMADTRAVTTRDAHMVDVDESNNDFDLIGDNSPATHRSEINRGLPPQHTSQTTPTSPSPWDIPYDSGMNMTRKAFDLGRDYLLNAAPIQNLSDRYEIPMTKLLAVGRRCVVDFIGAIIPGIPSLLLEAEAFGSLLRGTSGPEPSVDCHERISQLRKNYPLFDALMGDEGLRNRFVDALVGAKMSVLGLDDCAGDVAMT